MKSIVLSSGHEALVDDEDYAQLSKFAWCETTGGYAARTDTTDYTYVRMHRVILNAPDDFEVDHINGNRLDNRRSNLRLCSRRENMGKKKKYASGATSKFKGVCRRENGRWRAQIQRDGRKEMLGTFESQEQAARAYDAAAIKYFGEFARLNFTDGAEL